MRLAMATCLALVTTLAPSLTSAEAKLPVVVELFTSQGCSSCPPADAILGDMARMEGVIALSLHVDYWDYIGWPDSFAAPGHTKRQEAYALAAGEQMVYTPQIIINGLDRVVGGDAMAVMERVHAHADATTPVDLRVMREDDGLRVEASAVPLSQPVEVQLVRYIPEDEVVITAGENAGLTMAYHNIVTSWETIGTWDGVKDLSMTLSIEGSQPAVIILQDVGPGQIRAAVQVDH